MSLLNFEQNSNWLSQETNTNSIENNIDYFFTQRKVNELEEYIDEKTLERKKKKTCSIYNFLAINFPVNNFKNHTSLKIDIEIYLYKYQIGKKKFYKLTYLK